MKSRSNLHHEDDPHEEFLTILERKEARNLLFDFLQSKHSGHLLLFYEEVTLFILKCNMAGEQVADELKSKQNKYFYDTYVALGSQKQVNLTQEDRTYVLNELENDPCSTHAFEETARKILLLIEGDLFWEFQSTEGYMQWKAEHYDEIQAGQQKQNISCNCIVQ